MATTRKAVTLVDGVLCELSGTDVLAQAAVDGLPLTLLDLQTRVSTIETSASYTHNQNSVAATWNVTHNLGRYPAVTVVDSALTEVIGEVIYINANQCQLNFSAPFSGKAYFN